MLKTQLENGCMPDWHPRTHDGIDRIDGTPFIETAKTHEPTPRAAPPEEA